MAHKGNVSMYICSDDKEESKRVALHCCIKGTPCIERTYEWWYKDVSKSHTTFEKYPGADNNETIWVLINNTDYPIRYLCIIISSAECKFGGKGYIDLQRGT